VGLGCGHLESGSASEQPAVPCLAGPGRSGSSSAMLLAIPVPSSGDVARPLPKACLGCFLVDLHNAFQILPEMGQAVEAVDMLAHTMVAEKAVGIGAFHGLGQSPHLLHILCLVLLENLERLFSPAAFDFQVFLVDEVIDVYSMVASL